MQLRKEIIFQQTTNYFLLLTLVFTSYLFYCYSITRYGIIFIDNNMQLF